MVTPQRTNYIAPDNVLPWDLRQGDHVMLGEELRCFEVTAMSLDGATLTPCEELPKPSKPQDRRPWWQRMIWRRHG